MSTDDLRGTVNTLWESVGEGWRHLRESAATAVTRFRPGPQTQMPPRTNVDDPFYLSGIAWAILGADVFEDSSRIVVSLEIPGLKKQDLRVDISDGALVIAGEKRFMGPSGGNWRSIQRAYGAFKRRIPLPAKVRMDDAKATYENGVLLVELVKLTEEPPGGTRIVID